jgi:hypothetical protein
MGSKLFNVPDPYRAHDHGRAHVPKVSLVSDESWITQWCRQ